MIYTLDYIKQEAEELLEPEGEKSRKAARLLDKIIEVEDLIKELEI